MKKIALPVAVALATMFAGAAFAATETNMIKSVDTAKHTVTLDDGKVFEFKAGHDLSKLKAGEKVTVTYEKKGAMYEARDIVAAK